MTNTFVALLAEDSDHALPSGEKEISDASICLRRQASKRNLRKSKTARKELLAGLLWIHANADDVASALLQAPIALQLFAGRGPQARPYAASSGFLAHSDGETRPRADDDLQGLHRPRANTKTAGLLARSSSRVYPSWTEAVALTG
jgi:hypothetical protein